MQATFMRCPCSNLHIQQSHSNTLQQCRRPAAGLLPLVPRHAHGQHQLHAAATASKLGATSTSSGRSDAQGSSGRGSRGRGSDSNRGGRGGRGSGGGGRNSSTQTQSQPQIQRKRMWNGRWETKQDQGSDDFVIISAPQPGQAAAGSYRRDLEELDGSSFWAAAMQDGEEGEEWEDEEAEEEGEDGGLLAALQELLPDLEEPGETEEQAEWRRVYTSQVLPQPFLGHIHLTHVKGQGRGVVATEQLVPGRLLLVAPPLSVLYSEEGTTPENEELADHMLQIERFSPTQMQQLQALAPRGAGTSPKLPLLPPEVLLAQEHQEQQQQQQQQEGQLRQSAAATPSGRAEAEGIPAAAEAPALSMPRDELCDVVNANCYGEAFEDGVLCVLRGTSSAGHVGMWPALAMVNHSCCPNAAAYAIGGRMVMRAAQDVAAGEQLAITYLGQGLTSPLAQRHAELQEVYGFKCSCPRCKAEAKLAGGPLAALLDSTWERCQQLAPELDEAIEQGDEPMMDEVRQELLSLKSQLEGAMRTAKLSSKAKRWVQASVYDLYDLLSLCADQAPAAASKTTASATAPTLDTEALAECARILAAVAPGSSALCEVAVEYMLRTDMKFGAEHQEATSAAALAKAAVAARYGAPGEGIGARLSELLLDSHTMLSGEQGGESADEATE